MSDRESEPGEVQEEQQNDRQTKRTEEKQETKQRDTKTDEGKSKQNTDEEGKSFQKNDEGKSKQKTSDEGKSFKKTESEKKDDRADDEDYIGQSGHKPEVPQQIDNDVIADQGESENNQPQTNGTQENVQYTEKSSKVEEGLGVKVKNKEPNDDNKMHYQEEATENTSEERPNGSETGEKVTNVKSESENNDNSAKESEVKSDSQTQIQPDKNTDNEIVQDNNSIGKNSPAKTSVREDEKDEAKRSTVESKQEGDNNETEEDNSNDNTFITQISKPESSIKVSLLSQNDSNEQIHHEGENNKSSMEDFSEEKPASLESKENKMVYQGESKTDHQRSEDDNKSYGSTQEKESNIAEPEPEPEVNRKVESSPQKDTAHKEKQPNIQDTESGSNGVDKGQDDNSKDSTNTENKNYFYISTPVKTEANDDSVTESRNTTTKTADENSRDRRTPSQSEKSVDKAERNESNMKKDGRKQSEVESEYLDDEFDSASETSSRKVQESTVNKETSQGETEIRSKSINSEVIEQKENQMSDTEEQQNYTSPDDNQKHVDFNKRKRSNDVQKSPRQTRLNTQSPRRIVAEEKKQKRQTAKSADYRRLTSRGSPRRSHHAQPRPKTTGQRSVRSVSYSIGSEAGGRKQKEFFREELKRLQNSLQQEKSKIHKPKERDYYPYTFTSLEPYYNTYVASYLIELSEEQPHGFITRNTAQGLCDPWIALRMDQEILPKLEVSRKSSTAASTSRSQKKDSKDKDRPPKEGSTRLPKFPVVNFDAGKENATKRFPYHEIPQFREEMRMKFSPSSQNKVDSDYNRTKQDFYRMELDKIDEVHPLNRPHMRKAYFAYLQNTPGSRKAIKECAKSLPPCN